MGEATLQDNLRPSAATWWRTNRLLPGLLGVGLGLLFGYAGLIKHLHPEEFAEAILAYQLLPAGLVGLVGATLPWVELAAGFLLVMGYVCEGLGRVGMRRGWAGAAPLLGGLKRRSCLLLLMLLIAIFVIVLSVTMARGLKIDCGCGLLFQRQVGWGAVLEDVLLLALAGWLYWREW